MKAFGNDSLASRAPGEGYRLMLSLAPDNSGTVDYLYLDNESPVTLDQSRLDAVRKCLPRAELIKSDLIRSPGSAEDRQGDPLTEARRSEPATPR